MEELELFYRQHKDRLVNTIAKKIGDRSRAEDIVQEAFLKALKSFHNYDPKRGKISSWFNKIMYNELRDTIKQHKIELEYIDQLNIFSLLEPLSSRDKKAIDLRISEVVNKKHRQILRMFYIRGYNSREIGELFPDTSQSNVTTIIMRFKKTIDI